MRVPQRTNPNDFVDPLTFPLASPAGRHFLFSCNVSAVIELLNDIWCRYSWYPEEKS